MAVPNRFLEERYFRVEQIVGFAMTLFVRSVEGCSVVDSSLEIFQDDINEIRRTNTKYQDPVGGCFQVSTPQAEGSNKYEQGKKR